MASLCHSLPVFRLTSNSTADLNWLCLATAPRQSTKSSDWGTLVPCGFAMTEKKRSFRKSSELRFVSSFSRKLCWPIRRLGDEAGYSSQYAVLFSPTQRYEMTTVESLANVESENKTAWRWPTFGIEFGIYIENFGAIPQPIYALRGEYFGNRTFVLEKVLQTR